MERRTRARTIFAVMAVTYCFSQFYRMSTAVIAVDLAREFGLGPGQLSLLGGAFFYAFAGVQIPLGLALDRWGARRVILVGTLCGAAGAVGFGASPGWAGLLAARVAMGVGMAPVLMGSFKLIAGWFPATRFGSLSGLMLGLGTLGSLVAATPLAAAVGAFGWRVSFVGCGLATLGASLAVAAWVRDPPESREGPRPAALAGLGRVLRLPSFWAMAPLACVGYASVAAVQGLWGGPFFMESLGYTRTDTGNILLALGLSTAAGSFLWGAVSDRWLPSRKWVVVGGTLAGTAFLLPFLGVAAPAAPAGWGAALFGFGLFGASRTLIYAHIKESVPPAVVGTAVTAVNVFLMAGPALLQQAIGAVLERRPGAYPLAFGAVGGALLAGAAAYLATRDTHPGRSVGSVGQTPGRGGRGVDAGGLS